jgi:hypothetical protein
MCPFNAPPPGRSYPLEFAGHGQNARKVVHERFVENRGLLLRKRPSSNQVNYLITWRYRLCRRIGRRDTSSGKKNTVTLFLNLAVECPKFGD